MKIFFILHNQQDFPPMRLTLFLMVQLAFFSCAAPENPAIQHPPISTMSSETSIDLQGHRGARGLLPENTIPAFERAIDLGVTTLEMDVVISKDNQVVVSHEPWFSSHICSLPSGAPVPLAEEKNFKLFEMTYEEISQFDCGMRGNPRFPSQEKMRVHKPLLKDVIRFAESYASDKQNGPASILYNIETKSNPAYDNIFHPEPEVFARLLMDVLEAEGIKERTTIQSFDPRTLQVVHKEDASLVLALLVGNHDDLDFAGHIENLGFVPHIYSPNYALVDQPLVNELHARGIKVLPWTVNTLDEMQTLLALGVDGIITDYPDIGQQLIQKKQD